MSKLCLVCNPAPNKVISVENVLDPVCPGCGDHLLSLPPGKIVDAGDIVYGPTLFDLVKIRNPRTYRGRGRPRKSDYITITEAQKQFNNMINDVVKSKYILKFGMVYYDGNKPVDLQYKKPVK